jgi:hypothetical protein
MSTTITKGQVELYQGRDAQNCAFGYVHGDDGGFFFTWRPTLDATLDSVEVDSVDGDGGLDKSDVIAILNDYLPNTPRGRKMWGSDDE